MTFNPGTLDATGDVATESKQDDIIAELERANAAQDGLTFFTNPTLGVAMEKANPGFTGTPEKIHDGLDLTQWTATNLTGANFVFNSTTHAKEGIATVVDFNNLSGDAVTINGTNITNTTLTEGVDWTAATSNDATATSLASAYNGVAGVSATASGAIVTVIADDTVTQADITTFTSTDGTNLPVSAQSVDGSSAVDGDEALFTAPAPIDFDNFSTLTLNAFVVDWSTEGGAKEFELRFRNSGVDVGNSVNLSEFINIGSFSFWQPALMSKSEFGILGETVNEYVIKNVDSGAGNPPSVFFDIMQIEESGSPITFTLDAPPLNSGLQIRVVKLGYIAEGPANSITSIDNLPPEKFLSENPLANGIVSSATLNNTLFEGIVLRNNFDFISQGSFLFTHVSTNIAQSTVMVRLEVTLVDGLILKSSTGDKVEQVVNDDLTAFTKFRAFSMANLEVEPT